MKESFVHGCVMTSVASPFIRENGDVFQHFLLYSSIESLFYCCDEFLYTFADKVVELTRHHFTAKAQSNYLKSLKEMLPTTESIILGDFTEKNSFVTQD